MILAIYGSGGLGQEVYDIASRINLKKSKWEKIIFVDDFNEDGGFLNSERVKFVSLKKMQKQCEFIVAVGEPSSREELFKKIKNEGLAMATIIDPTAIISPFANIGEGVIVCEYSTIHTGVALGNNVLIQPFSNIGHGIKVGDHTVLSPYCAPGGNTIFGERVFVGMKTTLKENLLIGNDAIIGMGSVVYNNVAEHTTVVGNPARITRGNEEHKVFK